MSTPVLRAILAYDTEALSATLKRGSSPNGRASTPKLIPPLHLAVMLRQPSAVQLLLEAGANPNCADEIGRTALHYACMGATDPVIVKRLIDAGANVNAVSIYGDAPMDIAKWLGNQDAVAALVEASGRSSHVYNELARPRPDGHKRNDTPGRS